ncbi:hypothetical protein [Streptomyces spiralis]
MSSPDEMSDKDIRLAQIRAVRELIAGRADDATVRVADLHDALDNPIGQFMVDMMAPGPREVLALVRRTVQQKIDGELTIFQALRKIRELCEGFDWDSEKRVTASGEAPVQHESPEA